MITYRKITFAVWLFAAFSLTAQVSVSKSTGKLYYPETIEQNQILQIQNQHNRYTLDFLMRNVPEGFSIRLREPSNSTFAHPTTRVGFFNIEVGKIWSHDLSPELDKIEAFTEGDSGGIKLPLNFSGDKFELIFYMKENSPLLFFKLVNTGKTQKEVKVWFSFRISMNLGKDADYEKFAKNTSKTYSMAMKRQSFDITPSYLIFGDEKHQAGKSDKAIGPCLIGWNPESISRAFMNLRNIQYTQVEFILKKEFEYCEGFIFESGLKRSNEEFEKYITPWINKK